MFFDKDPLFSPEGTANRYCDLKESQHSCLVVGKGITCFSSTKALLQH